MGAPQKIIEARLRYKRCQEISDMARFLRIDATPEKVNRGLAVWERWYQGRLSTGYLMRITGVRRIKE